MLRIIQSQSVQQAKNYYTMGLKQEGSCPGEYYSQEQESVGKWFGQGADRLGLKGSIEQRDFSALCDNLHPQTGQSLTPRTQKGRRVGYDFNFHCPKSVSVVHALTGDDRILTAFQQSVTSTMRDIEIDAMTRVRKRGAEENRETGNLIWGDFTHFTARPVEGKPDPHLHSHCFVFNATWDPVENQWKAAQFGDIKRDARYYEAIFHSRLSKQIKDLGYSTRRINGFWEIEGLTPSVLEKYSRRTNLIERVAKERGILDPEAKAALGAKTRKSKIALQPGNFKEDWISRLSHEDRAALGALRNSPKILSVAQKDMTPGQALDYAMEHCFEKASVVPQRRIIEESLRHGFGEIEVDSVKKEFSQRNLIQRHMDGQTCCTTPQILAEERDCVHFVRDGRGTCFALKTGPHSFHNEKLSEEQKNAVLHVIHSRDRVMAIRGAAGTGKTTMMKEAVTAIEEGGMKVFTFAPSAEASRGVLRREGFNQAQTVSHLLENASLHPTLQGQVLWVDEAGLLSTRQMHGIFELADRQKCRVVLAGDTAQHRAVERGDALRLLETHAGIQAAVLSVNRRQRSQLHREAVSLLGQGRSEEGLKRLNELGSIAIIPESGQRYRQLAQDYTNALNQKKEVLAVSPTHAEGAQVTAAIREALRGNHRLGDKEKTFSILQDLRWTSAQRKDPTHYEPSMVVQFHREVDGFQKGEQAYVRNHGAVGEIILEGKDGSHRSLNLEHAKFFQVLQEKEISLAIGDKIRITQNGKTLKGRDLSNGEIVKVKGFTSEGDIRLTNNEVLPKGFGNLAYGYCVTSHAAQGKTVDQVLIAQSSRSEKAAYREQFYVSASRFRESIRIYTDDGEALRRAVIKSSRRVSAMDMVTALRVTNAKLTPRQIMWRGVFQLARKRMSSLINRTRILQGLTKSSSISPKIQGINLTPGF